MRGGGKPAGSCLPCNQQARSAPFHDSPCVESPEIPLAPVLCCRSSISPLLSSHRRRWLQHRAIASSRLLLVPRVSSLFVGRSVGSFARQVSPYFVPRLSLSSVYSSRLPLASSLTQTPSLCRPRSLFAFSLCPRPTRVGSTSLCQATARAASGFEPSRTMERDARGGVCARPTRTENKRTARRVRGCRSFVLRGQAKYCPNPVPLRAQGSRSKPRRQRRPRERRRTRPSSQIWIFVPGGWPALHA